MCCWSPCPPTPFGLFRVGSSLSPILAAITLRCRALGQCWRFLQRAGAPRGAHIASLVQHIEHSRKKELYRHVIRQCIYISIIVRMTDAISMCNYCTVIISFSKLCVINRNRNKPETDKNHEIWNAQFSCIMNYKRNDLQSILVLEIANLARFGQQETGGPPTTDFDVVIM